MKRLILAAFWLSLAPLGSSRAGLPVLSFDEVRAGMKGTGKTVFTGTRIDTFDVEILGKVPNVGPDQNLILGRLSGGPLAETGVLAGMSGSPITIDGKLVGAVAYSWGFAKEAIAGITPIEEMLALTREASAPDRRTAAWLQPSRSDLDRLRSAERLRVFFSNELRSLQRPTGALSLTIPLSVAGLDGPGLARVQDELAPAGFLPVQGGGAGQPERPADRPQPGSAIGLKLVRGDVDMTATGTVTWVDGDDVLALGHPLFGLGSVDLPLTGARVEALLPSLHQSARIATPLAEIGALRQDRASGVLARIDARPAMIPIHLELAGSSTHKGSFTFEIADDPLLSPILLYVSLNGILASKERIVGSATYRLRQGSMIQLAGNEPVMLDNVFAGPQAFTYSTGIAAYILYLLMNNTWSPPQIAGVNLLLDYEETPRTARIRRAAVDRYRVVAGESVEVSVFLTPYRGPDRVITREIQIPPETRPGRITLDIGGALEVSRAEEVGEPHLPHSLDQLIWLINQLRRNDQVYLLASQDDTGVLLGGARLPDLPPSVARVLSRPRSRGNFTVVPQRSIFEEELPTDYAVEGSARIELEVEAK